MRTPLATLVGLSFVACTGQIQEGGGDDVVIGENCGNHQIDPGETCDDGNIANGDGCSSACTTESTNNPRLTATIDRTNIATELGKTERVTLTLTSAGGFAGDVAVSTSVLDGANAPLTGVATVAAPATITVAANATVTQQLMIAIPSNATGSALAGMVSVNLAAPTGTQTLTAALNIEPIYTVTYSATVTTDAGTHPIQSGVQATNVTVKRGTKIRFKNESGIQHVTHGEGLFAHEQPTNDPNVGGLTGATYEQPTTQQPAGATGKLGCHNHGGPAGYVTFTTE